MTSKAEHKKISDKDREAALKNFKGYTFGPPAPINWIPTGHTVLDQTIASGHLMSRDLAEEKAMQVLGGFPKGKLVEIYGGPGSGKSSLAYRVCGYSQRLYPEPCIWYDCEKSFDEKLAAINGCDLSYLGRKDAENMGDQFYAEAILDGVIAACEAGASVVVLDSVGVLIPKAVAENPVEKDTMALVARILAKSLPKLAHAAAKSGTCVILINQIRTKPGVMYGSPDTTTGGNALPHNCSLIIKMNKLNAKDTLITTEDEQGNEIVIAQTSNCFIEKNRFGEPFRGAIPIPVYFRPYFPDFEEVLFGIGRQCKAISVRNGVFSWGGVKAEGRKGFIEAIKTQGLIDDLVTDVKKICATENIALPPEIMNYEAHLETKKLKQDAEIKKAGSKKKAKDNESVAANPEL